MYFTDHPPPHFHAEYGEYEAIITIADGEVFAGYLPSRAANLVRDWALLYTAELFAAWQLAQQSQSLPRLAPLL